jgi:hypothetical protein
MYEIQVWSEREWVNTPPRRRPRDAEHVDGLGWVVGVPVQHLN